jgi:hypothetical protein
VGGWRRFRCFYLFLQWTAQVIPPLFFSSMHIDNLMMMRMMLEFGSLEGVTGFYSFFAARAALSWLCSGVVISADVAGRSSSLSSNHVVCKPSSPVTSSTGRVPCTHLHVYNLQESSLSTRHALPITS